MFKVGDKVVYINDDELRKRKYQVIKKFETYTITRVGSRTVVLREAPRYNFAHERFVSVIDFRKQKLDKICSNLTKQ